MCQLKECEGFSSRWRAGSESLYNVLKCSSIRNCTFLMDNRWNCHRKNSLLYRPHVIYKCFYLWGWKGFWFVANIFIAKLECDVVRPFNPPFDDCFSKRKKAGSKLDDLLERLNSYPWPNIVFTVEENPDHFPDTAFFQVQLQSLQETMKTTNALEIRNSNQMENRFFYWCPPQS